MLERGIFQRLTQKEMDDRREIGEVIQADIENINQAREDLSHLKSLAGLLNTEIRYCKHNITINPAAIRGGYDMWKAPDPMAGEKDLPLTVKAYAYLLYYRDRLKHLEKEIRKQREMLRSMNQILSVHMKNLSVFDDHLNDMLRPDWQPCIITLKNGDQVRGEKDCNPITNSRGNVFTYFRYYDEHLNWMHEYRLDDIESFIVGEAK